MSKMVQKFTKSFRTSQSSEHASFMFWFEIFDVITRLGKDGIFGTEKICKDFWTSYFKLFNATVVDIKESFLQNS